MIREAAARHEVARELVVSIIRVESNPEPRAISRKGARGLMQLMPTTAASSASATSSTCARISRAGSDTSGIWSTVTAAISRSR
ncbi:MAG: hypothetical protein DME07_09205, partial [Candidatus Rokuibacteriota bacterium]